jgi:hypothetical protein
MKYILLIYCSEAEAAQRGDQVNQQVFQEYMTYSQDIAKSGHMVGGDPLEPVCAATSRSTLRAQICSGAPGDSPRLRSTISARSSSPRANQSSATSHAASAKLAERA